MYLIYADNHTWMEASYYSVATAAPGLSVRSDRGWKIFVFYFVELLLEIVQLGTGSSLSFKKILSHWLARILAHSSWQNWCFWVRFVNCYSYAPSWTPLNGCHERLMYSLNIHEWVKQHCLSLVNDVITWYKATHQTPLNSEKINKLHSFCCE